MNTLGKGRSDVAGCPCLPSKDVETIVTKDVQDEEESHKKVKDVAGKNKEKHQDGRKVKRKGKGKRKKDKADDVLSLPY